MIINTNFGSEVSRTYRLKVPTIDAICISSAVVETLYLKGTTGYLQWGQSVIRYISYSHGLDVTIGDKSVFVDMGDYLAKNEYGEIKHFKRELFLDSWEPDNTE